MILQHANPHAEYIAYFAKKINTLCMWICHSEAGISACPMYYQFYPRHHVGSQVLISKLFDTLKVFMKEFFEKVDFEKKIPDYKKLQKTYPACKELINMSASTCPICYHLLQG